MPTEYFQFGGFRPQIDWFRTTWQDEKALAEAIAGSSSPLRSKDNPSAPVELVLGIKRHGSSHLLLTTDERWLMERELRLVSRAKGLKPLYPAEFESLSPIYFDSAHALNKKLSTLKPKANKPKDTSQANRVYASGGPNIYRGAFEHGRVIFGILNNTINPTKYSLDDLSWTRGLRVCSFVFNTKGIDDRLSEQKLKNPIVLDVGFCDAQLPSLGPDYNTAKHVVNLGNRNLGGGKPKKPFSYGASEETAATAMPARVREFFKCHTQLTENPMILLVYNIELTMNYLHEMQVDTSAWRYSLEDLLMPQIYSQGRSNIASSMSDRRSRSRSPREEFQSNRNHSRYPHTRVPSSSGSGTGSRLYPPVFVLDVEQLFVKLMETDQIKDVVDVARRFGLTDSDWFCAGNEAALIIDIWRSMVSGLSIDEQRQQRAGTHASSPHPQKTPTPGPSTTQTHLPSAASGSDDEQDPNDIVTQPQITQPSSSTYGPADSWDESDYDTHSSSDDDDD